jgi:spore coat protein U-like protein
MRSVAALVALHAFLALYAPGAQAVIACNATVTSVSTSFVPASGATLIGSWSVNCTRAGGDPNTYNFSLGVNSGANPGGGFPQTKRVRLGATASYYTYQTYRPDNGVWWNIFGAFRILGTVNFGGALFGSATGSYRVTAAAQAAGPAGTDIDTLTWTLYQGTGWAAPTIDNGTFNVVFITNPTCSMTPVPNLTFNYTSFQGAAALASANFTVTCSDWLPYSMALDNAGPIIDSAVNLTYSLSLSATDVIGTGLAQGHSVNGTMPAGQSGNCGAAFCTNAASSNKTRTLTITY